MVKFATKYDYLCKHPYNVTIIRTDHRPLTHSLKSDLHEGIYGHWADKLRRFNIAVEYVPGPRNKCADGLSRTVYREENCTEDSQVRRLSGALATHGLQWIWKDGKDGYEQMLSGLGTAEREEILEFGTANGLSVFSLSAVTPSPQHADVGRQQDSSV